MILLILGLVALVIIVLAFVCNERSIKNLIGQNDNLISAYEHLLESYIKLDTDYLNLAVKKAKSESLLDLYRSWLDYVINLDEDPKKEEKKEMVREVIKDLPKEKPLFEEKKSRKKPVKAEQYKDDIVEMYVSGFSLKQIWERFNIDSSSIRKNLVRWGVYKPHYVRKSV